MRPHRRQPNRLPRPWDSPGKNTGVGCHFLLQCLKVKVKVKSLSPVRLLATPWTAAYQAPPSMGFSRQEYWSGVPLPSLLPGVDHNKLWKILKEMGIPDHLTCLLRNVYEGQEETVRTGLGIADWFKIGKGIPQGGILLPCLFNLYAEYIMWNVRLNEAQAGINIAGRNINNLRYTDDIILMAKRGEELKSLLMKVKEESEKFGLNSTFKKLGSWHLLPSLHGKWWGNNGNGDRLYFLGLQNHCRWWLQPWNWKMLAPRKKSYDQPRRRIKKQRH